MKSALAAMAACAFAYLLPAVATGQSTQGIISGRLVDRGDGSAIPGAVIIWTEAETHASGLAQSGPDGYYYLPQLSPGHFRIRVTEDRYQAQEVQDLELLVASRLDLNFRLRPLNDVWEQGEYRSLFLPGSHVILNFFGPDVDSTRSAQFEGTPEQSGALQATVSYVVDPQLIDSLPLAGRDVYTALVLLPGVTADTGTARGIGLSVAGQRPSAGNFLLDSLENNNFLITGPLTAIPPEAVQEYRVSTNNYSAEYGRTSGFVANAVTRSGTYAFHGIGYFYLQNDVLNANGFQNNLAGIARPPLKQFQTGFEAGGPFPRIRNLFWAASFEALRNRGRLPAQTFYLPAAPLLNNLASAGPAARQLLTQFTAPVPAASPDSLVGGIALQQPVSLDRSLAFARTDYRRGANNFTTRVAVSRTGRPDFIWSPYPGFVSGLDDNALSVAFGYERTFSPGLLNEAHLGFNTQHTGWNRAHPEIPTLHAVDATRTRPGTTLPGSPAFYSYLNDNRSGELVDNLTWTKSRQMLSAGGGLLIRSTSGFLNLASSGDYFFLNAASFQRDTPYALYASVLRGSVQLPNFDRDYRSYPWYAFAQDTFRLTPRLVLNMGLRYEHYGSPENTGGDETLLTVQGGMTVWQKNALLITRGKRLYRSDNGDWAPRAGFTFDPTGKGKTVLRAAYGLYYDHPFENLWQTIRNNAVDVPDFPVNGATNYLNPVSGIVSKIGVTPSSFPNYTMFDPNFREGRVQSYFYGVDHRFSPAFSVEVNGLGALGRHLITTDIINREFTTTPLPGRLDPAIPYDIEYRAPQGSSSYQAFTALAHLRGPRAQFQASYTWSHSLDNQSEPLNFDTFNLYFTGLTAGAPGRVSAFSRQFDSSADRGNSDFDSHHNLVFFSVWNPPAAARSGIWSVLTRDWTVSQIAAFRSGFPYTVYANATGALAGAGLIEPERANLINPDAAVLSPPVAVPGGKLLLNAAAFARPAFGSLGAAGRNAFRGPGLYNIDLSLSRSVPLPHLGESARAALRVDAFNIFNHANLGNPVSELSNRSFGVASYGRQDTPSGFPSLFPLNETARQLQLMLRVTW